jgi:hypothetical protein
LYPQNRITHSLQSTNLADILERVLDKGIVIAGDIKVCLADVELLSIKIRLVIASVDKAMAIGINWWQNDPALSTGAQREPGAQPDPGAAFGARLAEAGGLFDGSDGLADTAGQTKTD